MSWMRLPVALSIVRQEESDSAARAASSGDGAPCETAEMSRLMGEPLAVICIRASALRFVSRTRLMGRLHARQLAGVLRHQESSPARPGKLQGGRHACESKGRNVETVCGARMQLSAARWGQPRRARARQESVAFLPVSPEPRTTTSKDCLAAAKHGCDRLAQFRLRASHVVADTRDSTLLIVWPARSRIRSAVSVSKR